MKTNKNLVNLMLMSIVATVTVSFTACSDDIIDYRNGDSLIIATEGEKLEEPIGLVYKDFITPSDVTMSCWRPLYLKGEALLAGRGDRRQGSGTEYWSLLQPRAHHDTRCRYGNA